jgi:hypothetical protein
LIRLSEEAELLLLWEWLSFRGDPDEAEMIKRALMAELINRDGLYGPAELVNEVMAYCKHRITEIVQKKES